MRHELPSQFNPEIKTDKLDNESEIYPDISERRLQVVDNLNRYIASHETSEHSRVLRDKQMTVFVDIKDFLEKGNTEGYVEAPTGFGKTILFSEIVKAIDRRTLVVVPSRILVEQTYERFKQFNPDSDLGRVSSDHKELGKKVIITTYKSLILPDNGINPQDIDLLILDEAHRSLTGARIEAVGKFSNAIKLGFTATPEYSPDKRLDKLLNNNIHNITLKEAVETGLLSSFSVYLAETETDLSKVSITNNGDYDPKELEKAININSRNISAIELYNQLVEKNPDLSKAVVNCVSVRHALDVARLFQEAGIKAEAIYGAQNREKRDSITERYKEGQLQVLTNVNVLTEGFDVPDAALAINLRPTLSKVMAKQRGGRILRLDSENPNKHAIIVDYIDKNQRNSQVTFAQVAEGAQIFNPIESDIRQQEEKKRQEKEPKEPKDKLPLQIEGLKVITSTQEVLKVIKELEIKKNEISQVAPTDLVITKDSLHEIFIGRFEKIKPIIDEVIEDIKKENPDIVKTKRNKSSYITIVTDRDQFIQRMLDKGVRTKPSLDNIQAEGYLLTNKNVQDLFEGSQEKVFPIARETIEELKQSFPQTFFLKSEDGGKHYVPVTKDIRPFIEAMLKKGIKLRVSTSQTVGDNEFANTMSHLSDAFIVKNMRELREAANQVFEEIIKENPELSAQRKSGLKTVAVVTDRNLFLKKMQERGFMLRDKSIQGVQPTDFSISTPDLNTFFVGDTTKLLNAAREIAHSLGEKNPELIAKRKNSKDKKLVEVVTDRDLFIRLMQEKGIKIRPNIPH